MVLGMFGKALSPVPKPCVFLAEVARGIITLILTADLVTSSEGNGRGERVPEPCGQGAVGSRLSFGRSPVCPSCQWSGLWEGSKNPHWTRTNRNFPVHTEVREIDCHPQGLKHRMASGRDWRNNLGTEVMGGSLWVPEAGRSSFGQRSSHFLLFCKSSALVDSVLCPHPWVWQLFCGQFLLHFICWHKYSDTSGPPGSTQWREELGKSPFQVIP